MKYIIDTDKLPCNNGMNCTTCPFWPIDAICEIKEQVKNLPKYEERPCGEWKQVGEMTYRCTECGWLTKTCLIPYCQNCGSDNRKKEGDEK